MTLKTFFMGRTIGFVILAAVIIGVGGFYALNKHIYKEKEAPVSSGYKDAEYVIEGVRVKLVNGVAEVEAAPGSAAKIVTQYFGNEVLQDLDGDGREDIVFLLTQQSGGSGTFYYVVAALNTEHGYVGSEALLLGDRISPQTTEKGPGKSIVVNYADRAPGESFAQAPSVGKSIRLILDTASMQFGEVVQDFEGEADPSIMSLGMKPWTWVSVYYNDGRTVFPKKAGAFVVTFGSEGKFTALTDCNHMGGSYAVKASAITFSDIFSTKMFCEGSQEDEFSKLLENAQVYHFTSKGELVFDLKYDSGTVVFR